MREDNLRKLGENLGKLPPFPKMSNGTNGGKKYTIDFGTLLGWFIWKEENTIGVHRWFNSKGSVFQEHAHAEKEIIIVYDGIMEIAGECGKKILKPGDHYYIKPGEAHCALFPEDCWYITITMPRTKEFPDG